MNPERASRALAVTSMLASAGLSAAKIIVGLHANSTAVVSDGLESAGDVLASGLALFGLVLQRNHPTVNIRMDTAAWKS